LAAIINYQFNKQGDIYVYLQNNRYHCVLKIDNKFYDATSGIRFNNTPPNLSYIVYFWEIPYKVDIVWDNIM
jgi:hypothetical protein